jgi:hypothetical protein
MPEQRIELTDPELEGKAEQIGWEESYKLGRQKPGPVRIVIAVRCWPPACASQVQGPWTGGRLRRQVRL